MEGGADGIGGDRTDCGAFPPTQPATCPTLNLSGATLQVGTLRVTQQLVISLLNHIRAFSDWAQCFVLDIVNQYTPETESERFDILEVSCLGYREGCLPGETACWAGRTETLSGSLEPSTRVHAAELAPA